MKNDQKANILTSLFVTIANEVTLHVKLATGVCTEKAKLLEKIYSYIIE